MTPMRLLAILLALGACAAASGQGIPKDFVSAPELGLEGDDGKIVRLEDLAGSIVVLYFFRHG